MRVAIGSVGLEKVLVVGRCSRTLGGNRYHPTSDHRRRRSSGQAGVARRGAVVDRRGHRIGRRARVGEVGGIVVQTHDALETGTVSMHEMPPS